MNAILAAGNALNACNGQATDQTCVNIPVVNPGGDQLHTILQLVFGVLGTIALIYMLLAAMQFITSTGSPDKVSKARQSIIYGVIGLVVAAIAEILVTFVLNKL